MTDRAPCCRNRAPRCEHKFYARLCTIESCPHFDHHKPPQPPRETVRSAAPRSRKAAAEPEPDDFDGFDFD